MTATLRRPATLHLGAHRTGTTRLQRLLDQNRPRIEALGVLVLTPPRAGKRDARTIREAVRATQRAADAKTPFRRFLRRRTARAAFQELVAVRIDARLLISEENLLGPTVTPDGLAFYPKADRYLSGIERLWGVEAQAIQLTIRSYASFLVSSYAIRAAYAEAMPPFDAIRDRMMRFEKGWPELVATIRACFPTAALTVRRFETSTIDAQLTALFGDDHGLDTTLAEEVVNAAPTTQAIAAAQALPNRVREEIDALIARHAGGDRFDPLSADEKAALEARYQADCARLAATQGIDFVA